jgi:transketolase
VRTEASDNLCARGGYRIRTAQTSRQVVLMATGSEVEVALATADALEGQGVGADVVSMPCWSLFDAQDAGYRADILPEDVLRVSIEAGTTLGWERYVGPRGIAIGLDRFGASAPAEDLFKRFGFTAAAIVPQILTALQTKGDQ